VRRRLTWAVPAVLALFGSAWELAPSWREILLAFNSQSFGVKDPQFGIDISFYVFILPAVLTLVSFLSGVVLFAGVASIVVHYLYGGISVVRKPHFTKAARMHLAIFLALYAVIRAVGYWLGRYSALYASNSKFDGANYTDVNAVIPANAILAAIGLAVAFLFVASVRSSSWRLPIIGVVVMIVSSLVVGTAYPLVIQKFIVDPNAQRQEAEYIQRNINATKAAYGLQNVETTNYDATTKTAAGQLEKDAESTTSIRLLDPGLISPTFQQVQQNKQYYSFANRLNVDRYKVDSTSRDTVIAVRELNLSGLGEQQQTWVNEHTVYTHGYGVVNAYGNTVATRGYPSSGRVASPLKVTWVSTSPGSTSVSPRRPTPSWAARTTARRASWTTPTTSPRPVRSTPPSPATAGRACPTRSTACSTPPSSGRPTSSSPRRCARDPRSFTTGTRPSASPRWPPG